MKSSLKDARKALPLGVGFGGVNKKAPEKPGLSVKILMFILKQLLHSLRLNLFCLEKPRK